jgi:outer membrane protein TolC
MQRKKLVVLFLLLLYGPAKMAHAQVLTLKEAVQTAMVNYGTIKAKANYLKATQATAQSVKREYLPNLNLAGQQDYGTINSIFGPSYGQAGGAIASSGPTLAQNNWNSAFGSLYFANVNWDFFSFGRIREKIKTAQATVERDSADLTQEKFQHEVRVAAAYLNLLAAQRLTQSWKNNLDRADTLRFVVVTRVKNGLIPGVDSSLANAEVANARIAYTNAKDAEQTQSNNLSVLMGVPPQDFVLDTVFVKSIPSSFADSTDIVNNPTLQFYAKQVKVNQNQARYLSRQYYPTFSLFGTLQSRGSGFGANYAADQSDYTKGYWDGVKPNRTNYLVGVGVSWNLTTILRVHKQVSAQQYTTAGIQDQYDLVRQQLTAQLKLSDIKMKNALNNYREAPIQVSAASDAYNQRTVLYKNGLNTIVDVTQVLYTLNRAETDRDIAYANVWQALLLKAAASGNFSLFINEF